jgi:hypothetical protein
MPRSVVKRETKTETDWEEMMAVRVYVDFNTITIDGKYVEIRKDGVGQLDQTVTGSLRLGSQVMLHDGEMEVEATVVGESENLWLAEPNWATRRDFDDSGAASE